MKKPRGIGWQSRVIFAVTTLLLSLCGVAIAQSGSPCSQPEYRAFDFWAGDWDVFEAADESKVASARVDVILDAACSTKIIASLTG